MIAPLDICTKLDVLFKNNPKDFSLKTILNSLEKSEVRYVSTPILSNSTIKLSPSFTPLFTILAPEIIDSETFSPY